MELTYAQDAAATFSQVPSGDGLLTKEEYVKLLEAAGLEVKARRQNSLAPDDLPSAPWSALKIVTTPAQVVEDRTSEWSSFIWSRLEDFLQEHRSGSCSRRP